MSFCYCLQVLPLSEDTGLFEYLAHLTISTHTRDSMVQQMIETGDTTGKCVRRKLGVTGFLKAYIGTWFCPSDWLPLCLVVYKYKKLNPTEVTLTVIFTVCAVIKVSLATH